MKKYLCCLLLIFFTVSTSFAEETSQDLFHPAILSFTTVEIGNMLITFDQWGDWFCDSLDVFDDLIEEI